MKKRISFIFIFIVSIISCADDQNDGSYQEQLLESRREKDERFKNEDESPLKSEDIDGFQGLSYFPIDKNYLIRAKFVKTPWDEPFQMPATGKKTSYYVRYGIAKFEIDGQKVQLNIYENLDEKEKGNTHYFVPFKDATSGEGTYGGGRYLDLQKPEGDSVTIDFNKAYNPYCVYNTNYSCPIPPKDNWLKVAIKAGEKNWDY